MSSDLLAFLRARLDEDERVTASVHDMPMVGGCRGVIHAFELPCSCGIPERWRREIEAKRKLLDLHEEHEGRCVHCVQWCDECENQTQCNHGTENRPYPCPTVRLLGAPFSDHPDYNPDWAPT